MSPDDKDKQDPPKDDDKKKTDPPKDPPKKTEPAKVEPMVDTLEIKLTGMETAEMEAEVAKLLSKQQAEIDVLKADKLKVEKDAILAKIKAGNLDPKDYEKLPIEVLKGVIITLEDKNLVQKEKIDDSKKMKKGPGHLDSVTGKWVN